MSGDDGRDTERPSRPPSVRDTLREEDDARPTPVRDTGGGEDDARPTPVRDTGGEDDDARPTPVRLSMDAQRDEPEPREPPSTRLRRGEDEEWIVRAEGWAVTGGEGDAGAPLLFLTFARADDPERRLLEAIRVGRTLEDLGEDALLAALDGARSYEGAEWERSDLFAGTRRKRGS